MADLKPKIKADLSQLKKDLQDIMKGKVTVKAEGGGGGKGGGGAGGMGKGIMALLSRILGPLAIIGVAMEALQPIVDIIRLIFFLLVYFILKGWKAFITTFGTLIMTVWQKIVEAFKGLWAWLKEKFPLLQVVEEIIKSVWAEIKTFIANWKTDGFMSAIMTYLTTQVPGLINTVMTIINNALREKVNELMAGIPTWLSAAIGVLLTGLGILLLALLAPILGLPAVIIAGILVLVAVFWDVIKDLWVKLGGWLIAFGSWIKGAWVSMVALFKSMVAGIASIPSKISSAIKGAISSMNPFKSDKKKKVSDAILRPDGTMVETDPMDTIIATKNPSGMGGSKVMNFYGVTPEQMMNYIRREQGVDVNRSGRF